jgi:hypothetical protein
MLERRYETSNDEDLLRIAALSLACEMHLHLLREMDEEER